MTAVGAHGRVRLSIVVPCFNEQDNIDQLMGRTLRTLDEVGFTAELVPVDDGSTDLTWNRLSRWADRDARVRPTRHRRNNGIEAAWRTGLANARGSLICLIDADLQNRPEDIAALCDAYDRRAVPAAGQPDLVQGVRRPVNAPLARYLLSRGLNVVLNATFGMDLADNKSGFILCRREVLEAILRHRFTYRYYQCFLTAAAHARGFAIHQVDTRFEPRTRGQSFLRSIPLRAVARIVWEVVKARIDLGCAGRRCPDVAPVRAAETINAPEHVTLHDNDSRRPPCHVPGAMVPAARRSASA